MRACNYGLPTLLVALVLQSGVALGEGSPTRPLVRSLERFCAETKPGAHIKLVVKSGSGEPMIGSFQACGEETLVIRSRSRDGGVARVPFDEVDSLYVGDGKSGASLTGALIGFLVGVAILYGSETSDDSFAASDIDEHIDKGLMVVAVSTAAGITFGSAVGGERWRFAYSSAPGSSFRTGCRAGSRLAFVFSF